MKALTHVQRAVLMAENRCSRRIESMNRGEGTMCKRSNAKPPKGNHVVSEPSNPPTSSEQRFSNITNNLDVEYVDVSYDGTVVLPVQFHIREQPAGGPLPEPTLALPLRSVVV